MIEVEPRDREVARDTIPQAGIEAAFGLHLRRGLGDPRQQGVLESERVFHKRLLVARILAEGACVRVVVTHVVVAVHREQVEIGVLDVCVDQERVRRVAEQPVQPALGVGVELAVLTLQREVLVHGLKLGAYDAAKLPQPARVVGREHLGVSRLQQVLVVDRHQRVDVGVEVLVVACFPTGHTHVRAGPQLSLQQATEHRLPERIALEAKRPVERIRDRPHALELLVLEARPHDDVAIDRAIRVEQTVLAVLRPEADATNRSNVSFQCHTTQRERVRARDVAQNAHRPLVPPVACFARQEEIRIVHDQALAEGDTEVSGDELVDLSQHVTDSGNVGDLPAGVVPRYEPLHGLGKVALADVAKSQEACLPALAAQAKLRLHRRCGAVETQDSPSGRVGEVVILRREVLRGHVLAQNVTFVEEVRRVEGDELQVAVQLEALLRRLVHDVVAQVAITPVAQPIAGAQLALVVDAPGALARANDRHRVHRRDVLEALELMDVESVDVLGIAELVEVLVGELLARTLLCEEALNLAEADVVALLRIAAPWRWHRGHQGHERLQDHG